MTLSPTKPAAEPDLETSVATDTRDAAAAISDVEVPQGLTVLERKRELFAIDNYFREAWWDLASVQRLLHRLAVVVFKPDAVVGRRIAPCLRLLHDHGYTILGACSFRYTRHLIRETWRYQFNIASRDRIAVVDRLLTSTPSLLVVIGDRGAGELPASVRLGALKGPSEPSLRRAGEIRYELGVLTTLFNFIHTSDEPLDVVREIGVALDPLDRQTLAANIGAWADASASTLKLAGRLEARHAAHDLDRDRSLERLSRHADRDVRDGVQRVRDGDPDAWRTIFDAVPRVAEWDALSVATASIDCNVVGLQAVLPTIAGEGAVTAWRERASPQ